MSIPAEVYNVNMQPYAHAGQTLMLAHDVEIDKDSAGMKLLAQQFRAYSQNPRTLPKGTTFECEDYWDRLSGCSWFESMTNGNPAAIQYAFRTKAAGLPLDNQVVYGKIGALGYLMHVSELEV